MDKLFPELSDIDNRRIEDIGAAMEEIIRLQQLLRRAYRIIELHSLDNTFLGILELELGDD